MKNLIINHTQIEELLASTKEDPLAVDDILDKAKTLQGLNLKEIAYLLQTSDQSSLDKIFRVANEVKELIYGKRLVIFAPLYLSNLCINDCLYCAFRVSNKELPRHFLSQSEVDQETLALLKTGQKRILLVAGETYPQEGLSYVYKSIETIYSVKDGLNNIRRLNVNIAPLSVSEFKALKKTEIGTYQLFQETYSLPSYRKYHISGPKSDYEYRLSVMDRALEAGLDDIGVGVLFGLADYKFEVLALMQHINHLETTFGLGPHTISVPRLEPATGSNIASKPPYPVSDLEFQKIIAILRLAVPYTGIILSTRENAETRQACYNLGVSQISAGSKTNPGGYSSKDSMEQFSLGDYRSLDEVVADICSRGYIPSFCTSCYRLGRTGLDFMEYAKPGDIKKKCQPNAIFTFQEYLKDYASEATKILGKKFIQAELAKLTEKDKAQTLKTLELINQGQRDLFV